MTHRYEEGDHGTVDIHIPFDTNLALVTGPSDSGPELWAGGAVCDNGCCHAVAIGMFFPTFAAGVKISLEDADRLADHIKQEVLKIRAKIETVQ